MVQPDTSNYNKSTSDEGIWKMGCENCVLRNQAGSETFCHHHDTIPISCNKWQGNMEYDFSVEITIKKNWIAPPENREVEMWRAADQARVDLWAHKIASAVKRSLE